MELHTDKDLKEMKAAVTQAADRGIELAKERIEFLREETADLVRQTERAIRKNPLRSIAIAAGVGVIFAGLAGAAVRGLARS